MTRRGPSAAVAACLAWAAFVFVGAAPAPAQPDAPADPLEVLSEIEALAASHPADLGVEFRRDAPARRRLFEGVRRLAEACKDGGPGASLAERIRARIRALVLAHPRYFRDDATIDVLGQPHVAALRVRLWLLLAAATPPGKEGRTEFAEATGLSGPEGAKRELWTAHGMLVLDNNGFDRRRLAFMKSLAGSLPPRSFEGLSVACRQFLEPPMNQLVLRKGSNGEANVRLEIQDGVPWFSFDRVGADSAALRDKEALPSEAWTHVAVAFDGWRIRFYRNGAESASVEAGGMPVRSSRRALTLGRDDDLGLRFRGEIGEARFWNRALAPEEIAAEAKGVAASSEGLAGSWQAGGADSIPDSPDLRLGPAMTIAVRLRLPDERVPMEGLLNLGAAPVGGVPENPFPQDGPGVSADGFCLSSIFMLHFSLCDRALAERPALRAERDSLVRRAGKEPMQYLRSMFVQSDGSSLFVEYPVGLLPSLSQQYFADTWRMLDLALSRFDRGWKEPLHQFLFFAAIHARDETMRTFVLDKEGALATAAAPVETDADGRIVRIRRGGRAYEFRRGKEGEVLSYRTEGFDSAAPVRVRFAGASLRDALSILRRDAGLRFLAGEDALRAARPVTMSEVAPLGRILAEISRQSGVSCETTAAGAVVFGGAANPR